MPLPRPSLESLLETLAEKSEECRPYASLVCAAAKTWNRSDAIPWPGSLGFNTVTNGRHELPGPGTYNPEGRCCLIGASMVGRLASMSSWFEQCASMYGITYEEAMGIAIGFDAAGYGELGYGPGTRALEGGVDHQRGYNCGWLIGSAIFGADGVTRRRRSELDIPAPAPVPVPAIFGVEIAE